MKNYTKRSAYAGQHQIRFQKAYLYVADWEDEQNISANQDEVDFTEKISVDKYDIEAQLIDKEARIHPAYCIYVEKM